MVQPNNDCIGFCNWMLTISKQRLSGPQRILVTSVYNAALGSYAVSSQDWYNFNLFTAWRNPFYLVYRDYASVTVASLLTDLIVSINFEGNADNLVSGTPSTLNDVTFGLGWGKILQGVKNSAASPDIAFSGGSVGSIFSLNLWAMPDNTGVSWQGLIGGGSGASLILNKTTFLIDFAFASQDHTFTSQYAPSTWQMLTVVSNGSSVLLYYNGVLDATYVVSVPPLSFSHLFNGIFATFYTGAMDMLSIWQRVLSPSEVASLYNAGSGIQYPF